MEQRTFEVDPSFRGLIGVGRCDMTPQPGIYSRGWGSARHDTAIAIHRPLYATALCLRTSCEDAPCIIATIDYSWFRSHRFMEALRRPVIERLQIEDHKFLLIVTHSHAVPHADAELENEPGGDKIAVYRAKVQSALLEAIRIASENARPAILSWGSGHASLARARDFRDPLSDRILCGPNPNGIADSTLYLGRVTDESNGQILATLVNYACHPVSLGGGNRSVSPDYVGSMCEILESHTGGAPCMFLHGASGNQTPRDSYSDDPRVADRNGQIIGYAALSVLSALLPPGKRLEFAGMEASGADLAIWQARPYSVDPVLRSTVRYLSLPPRQWPTFEQIDARLSKSTETAEQVRLSRLKQFLENFKLGLAGGFPVWAIRMGRAVLIGTPAEAFTDLQVELRKRFPALAIIVTNDTNGSFNYLPPATYFGNGAYEQDCTDFGPGALEVIIAAAAELIESLMVGTADALPPQEAVQGGKARAGGS